MQLRLQQINTTKMNNWIISATTQEKDDKEQYLVIINLGSLVFVFTLPYSYYLTFSCLARSANVGGCQFLDSI